MTSSFSPTVLFLVVIGALHVSAMSVKSHSHTWSYEGETGPAFWAEIDPTCGGKSQSPINIDLTTAGEHTFMPLNYLLEGGTFKLHNNGHSVQVDVSGGRYEFSGAGLPGEKYRMDQFHWHWGSVNTQGSEHTVDGVQYAAENHFVLHNMKYPDFNTAKTHPDGVAVISHLISVGAENPAYGPIVAALPSVINLDDEVDVPSISVRGLMPSDLAEFARYRGSLTTPSCLETVVWTVMLEPVEVSQSQLDAFRSLKDTLGHPLVDNFRPTQPLNGRQVQQSD